MNAIAQPVKGISHPFVRDIYIKRGATVDHKAKNILVIETGVNTIKKKRLMDVLTDLQDLQSQAANQVEEDIDEVDIRLH